MFVTPHLESLDGRTVYPDVQSLSESPELAIIATPPESIPAPIAELSARGAKAAVAITAGFGQIGPHGKALQQAALEAARPYGLRLVGPNCVGVIVPRAGLNAGFSHLSPPEGDLAFVSQSGAMVTAVLDSAVPQGIGFSHVVSLGDMAGGHDAGLADSTAAPAMMSRGIVIGLAITLIRCRSFALQVSVHRGRLWHVDGPRRKTASDEK